MITSINYIVPFGTGEPRRVSTLLIGNIGGDNDVGYSYLALYYEPQSSFSSETLLFKQIENYTRKNPMLTMLQTVYDRTGWVTKEQLPSSMSGLVKLMLQRLNESNYI